MIVPLFVFTFDIQIILHVETECGVPEVSAGGPNDANDEPFVERFGKHSYSTTTNRTLYGVL